MFFFIPKWSVLNFKNVKIKIFSTFNFSTSFWKIWEVKYVLNKFDSDFFQTSVWNEKTEMANEWKISSSD